MKIPNPVASRTTLISIAVASSLLTACAAARIQPLGAAQVRSKRTQLHEDPDLVGRAAAATEGADAAVLSAEAPQVDAQLGAHRVFLADRRVEIALAETQFLEDQRTTLVKQRE
jgi:hypothetical protein